MEEEIERARCREDNEEVAVTVAVVVVAAEVEDGDKIDNLL